MKLVERFTKQVIKWATLYPRVAKVLSWAYYDLMKMPQYHVELRPGEVGPYVILVDDPQVTQNTLDHVAKADLGQFERDRIGDMGLLDLHTFHK